MSDPFDPIDELIEKEIERVQNKDYVLGFMFNYSFDHIVLIRKNKPAWQAGKFNGLGGKKEKQDDTFLHAMVREFYEEAKIETDIASWYNFANLDGPDFHVACYWTVAGENIISKCFRSFEEGLISNYNLKYILSPENFGEMVPNVPFLITLAIAKSRDPSIGVVTIPYESVKII